MTVIEGCRALPFIRVDCNALLADGGIQAWTSRCRWPLKAGDRVLAIDGPDQCEAIVRKIQPPNEYGCDLILDLDIDTWREA